MNGGWRLRHAAALIRSGGIVAYPTEAVYGLGCDPLDPAAVLRLLALKQRPQTKGLILIGADFRQLRPYMDRDAVDEKSLRRLRRSWPGPVTWLLPAAHQVPQWLRGAHDTIALRVTAHPLAAALGGLWGGAVVSTSANPAGRPPARTALDVRRYFGANVDCILSGETGGAPAPTEIRDARSGRIVRPG
ncbi:MAG: L-threonylcarbamoyladenylate synthase [Gammaproteobacteria bacterium]